METELVIVDDARKILWCGTDETEARRVADYIEREHGRAVYLRERSPADIVPSEVEGD